MRIIDAEEYLKTLEAKAKTLKNEDTINGICGAVALLFEVPTVNIFEDIIAELEHEMKYPTDGDICYSAGLNFAWDVVNKYKRMYERNLDLTVE